MKIKNKQILNSYDFVRNIIRSILFNFGIFFLGKAEKTKQSDPIHYHIDRILLDQSSQSGFRKSNQSKHFSLQFLFFSSLSSSLFRSFLTAFKCTSIESHNVFFPLRNGDKITRKTSSLFISKKKKKRPKQTDFSIATSLTLHHKKQTKCYQSTMVLYDVESEISIWMEIFYQFNLATECSS